MPKKKKMRARAMQLLARAFLVTSRHAIPANAELARQKDNALSFVLSLASLAEAINSSAIKAFL